MKTTVIKLAGILLVLVLTKSSLMAQINQKKEIIKVNGLVHLRELEENSNCIVYLFNENRIIDSLNIETGVEFEFKLNKNSWYSIKITKEGFYPVLISLNTEVPSGARMKKNKFWFETDMIKISSIDVVDKDVIDFPVGIVSFDKEKKCFDAHDKYTKYHMKRLFNVYGNSSEVVTSYK